MRGNCLLVAIGWLFQITADELLARLQEKLWPTRDDGVERTQMGRVLRGIGGLRTVVFNADPKSVFNTKMATQQWLAIRILQPWIRKYGSVPFALAYQRPNRTGHVVVARKFEGRKGDDWGDYQFTCFQKHTEGEDRTWDVIESYMVCAIFVEDVGSDQRQAQVEFYGELVDGVVSHLQSSDYYDKPDGLSGSRQRSLSQDTLY
jgi:hypothetical protein